MTSASIEFRHLRYFIAVVERQSFRAAALALHVSQPPLTRQLQQLEKALGVKLLTRTSTGVEPTAAGKLYYEEARHLLTLSEQAAARAHLAGHGQLGRLDVGVNGSAVLGAIPQIIRTFRGQYPDADVVLHSLDRASQIKALHEHRIAVGFNRFFTTEKNLTWEVIQTEQMHVALHHQHPLATRKTLRLSDIGDQRLILYPRYPRPGFIDMMMRLFDRQGIAPYRIQEVDDVITAVALVASGLGITLVTDSGCNLQVPGIVHLPLRKADNATVDLCMIYRDRDDSPLLDAFLMVARNLKQHARPRH
jgi:LysR family transcriptional regulator, benzoate and cis,cis-muconate-responsive activator of ben and cat genes